MTQEPKIFPYIARLLQGAEVVWKPLGEVCKVVTDFTASGSFASNAKNIKYLKEPDYALLVRTTDLKRIFKNSENFIYVDKHAFEYLWRVNLDVESIILPNVGNCGEVYYSTPQILPYENCVLGPNAILLRSDEVNNKYLYYLFQGNNFQRDLSKITSSTGQTKFNKTNLKQIEIPLPPLSIQQEIVRILDKFTQLEAELEAELDCRKRQYEYYRNNLLSYEGNEVEWKTLGEVGVIQRGASPRPISNYITDDENAIPWIKIGDTGASKYVTNTEQKITKEGAKKARMLKKGDFIISNSMSYGRPYILGIDGAIHDGWASISDFQQYLNPDFLYHYLLSDKVQQYWKTKINSGSVSNLNSDIIKSLKIPLLPLEEQQRIATILDKFDTLVNSISEGLPKEIALRRKQYEYYREKLLSFPKK